MEGARSEPRTQAGWPLEVAATLAVVSAATGAAWLLSGRESLPDAAMIYLLGIVAVAMRFSFFASILAAILSVLSYDFFFVPPYLSFTVNDGRHVITFGVMFIVGVVISTLTRRIRDQAAAAGAREEHTAQLYALARELSAARAEGRLGEIAARHLHAMFDGDVVLLLPGAAGRLEGAASDPAVRLDEAELRAADSALRRDQAPGEAAPGARFVPLIAARGTVGVLRVAPRAPGRFADPEQRRLLDTFAAQIAGALERTRSADEAETARIEAEAERLQSSLLSSFSHDLRTPLAVITGAATTLLAASSPVEPATQRDLLGAIVDESVRLSRLVGNLLDMTRLAAGAMKVHKEWQSIEAVVGAAIRRTEDRLGGRPVRARVPHDLPLVPFDAVLVEQVLINLLENAAKYAPAGAPVDVWAGVEAPGEVTLAVEDQGPGVPEAERTRIFDKFYRVPGERGGGAGLGLAICRGIVEAHGGRIGVEDREGGGAVFRFTLPIEGLPPVVEEDGGTP